MTQAYGTGAARSFEFAYEPLGVGLGGLDRDLAERLVAGANGRERLGGYATSFA